MTVEDTLWDLERRIWMEGAEHMAATVDPDAVMVLPFTGVLSGQPLREAWRHEAGWAELVMSERSFRDMGGTVLLAYRAEAVRRDGARYVAYCASTYLRDGEGWRMMSHQQTPAG